MVHEYVWRCICIHARRGKVEGRRIKGNGRIARAEVRMVGGRRESDSKATMKGTDPRLTTRLQGFDYKIVAKGSRSFDQRDSRITAGSLIGFYGFGAVFPAIQKLRPERRHMTNREFSNKIFNRRLSNRILWIWSGDPGDPEASTREILE